MAITRFHIHNQRGAGLITIVALILVMGVIGAVFVSLISTESFTAMGQEAGERAAGLAEGGIEFILKDRTFPAYSMVGASLNLGSGSFTVDSPAYLTVAVPLGPGPNVTITVNDTQWFEDFPVAGGGTVGLIIDGEEIECGSISPDTNFINCNDFSGAAVTGGQPVNTEVYPVSHLNTGGGPLGQGASTITVNSTRGFLSQGTIRINNEIIYYTGTTATTFTGCTRGYKGTPDRAHPDTSSVSQYTITSTGTVPTGVIGNAQRVVRVTVGP